VAAFAIPRAFERARALRIARVLDDHSTRPSKVDLVAWESDSVTLLHATAGTVVLEESWAGGPPLPRDLAFGLKMFGRVASYAASRNGGQLREDESRALLFHLRPPLPPNMGGDGAALVVSSRVISIDPGDIDWVTREPRLKGRELGSAPLASGSLADVRARVLHVLALREAFGEARASRRASLIEPFLRPIGAPTYDALNALGRCDDKVPALKRFLEDETAVAYHSQALRELLNPLRRDTVRDLGDYLEHEAGYWRRLQPRLQPKWLLDCEPPEAYAHHEALCEALQLLLNLEDRTCREQVTTLREVLATLPPTGFGSGGSDELGGLMRRLEAMLELPPNLNPRKQ
jgi:hypothetical protein